MNPDLFRYWLPPLNASGETRQKVLQQCRAEMKFAEEHPEIIIWQFRPTRLFWLLDFFSQNGESELDIFLEAELNRLGEALQLNYYCQAAYDYLENHPVTRQYSEIKDIMRCAAQKKPLRGRVAVPLVNESPKNPFLPMVSFAHFKDISDHGVPCSEQFSNLGKLQTLLSESWQGYRRPSYWLDMAACIGINGQSYELGYCVHAWLAMHDFPDLPSICCTGLVGPDGRIGSIKDFYTKIEAALAKNYEYCLVAAADLKGSRYSDEPRVIGFDHVDELDRWLLEHTGSLPARREVINWLSASRNEPNRQIFNLFFNQMLEEGSNPVVLWKNTLGQHAIEEKCEKLRVICHEFVGFLARSDVATEEKQQLINKALRMIAPADLFYSLLIEALLEKCPNNLIQAEILYKDFAESLLNSDLDIINASERIKTMAAENYLQHPDFQTIRRRYPLALTLLYRNPADLLWLFSRLESLSTLEQNLFASLIKNVRCNIAALKNPLRLREAEAKIMQEIHCLLTGNSAYRKTDLQQSSKRMPKLFEAIGNFAARGQHDAADLCRLLLADLIHTAAGGNESIASQVNKLLQMKSCKTADGSEALAKDPRFKTLISRISGKTDPATSSDNFAAYKKATIEVIELMQNPVQKHRPRISWFPQPAFAIYSSDRNWEKILESFHQSYPGSGLESQLMKSECLANWKGRLDAGVAEAIRPDKPGNRRWVIPYLSGWYALKMANTGSACSLEQNKTCHLRRYITDPAFTDFANLFWVLFSATPCRQCLEPVIQDLLKGYQFCHLDKPETAIPEKKCQLFIRHAFAFSLFIQEKCASWEHMLRDFFIEPHQVRRTAQLLIPIYLAIKERAKLQEVQKRTWGMSNNSNFVVEYIRVFCLPKTSETGNLNYFRPVQWQMSLDRQIFNTICISSLVNDPDTLRHFIIEKIDDFPNLFLALQKLA